MSQFYVDIVTCILDFCPLDDILAMKAVSKTFLEAYNAYDLGLDGLAPILFCYNILSRKKHNSIEDISERYKDFIFCVSEETETQGMKHKQSRYGDIFIINRRQYFVILSSRKTGIKTCYYLAGCSCCNQDVFKHLQIHYLFGACYIVRGIAEIEDLLGFFGCENNLQLIVHNVRIVHSDIHDVPQYITIDCCVNNLHIIFFMKGTCERTKNNILICDTYGRNELCKFTPESMGVMQFNSVPHTFIYVDADHSIDFIDATVNTYDIVNII